MAASARSASRQENLEIMMPHLNLVRYGLEAIGGVARMFQSQRQLMARWLVSEPIHSPDNQLSC